jgi:hypothetical protein
VSTSRPSRTGNVPEHLRGLVDDAAVFPPGNAPLDVAVRAHAEHRAAPYADLVGPLVVGDAMLPDLVSTTSTNAVSTSSTNAVSTSSTTRGGLGIAVVVSGGAGALEPAVRWATRGEGVALRGVEIALRDSATGELAHNARRIVTAVDQLVSSGDLDEDVPVYVETPRLSGAEPTPDWLAALDEVAAMDHRLKFRTGGVDADAFPSSTELATLIGAALDRELAFKCTAGLHHALRHRDAETGFEHHGFLNVLLATRASLDGAGTADVAAVLDETDPARLMGGTDEAGLAGARRWFRSFGSCSVLDPVHDLTALGLMEKP